MEKGIMVSIVCMAYNHGAFIRDALNSFVSQITNFKVEILIHDDASTDETADIIRNYEERYPEMVRPIYQKNNQYSKGVEILSSILFPLARGKYIALCEGDDYWSDLYKLQKQVDYLEQHEECSLCVHGADVINAVSLRKIREVCPFHHDCCVPIEQIIVGEGGFFSTNSMVFQKKYVEKLPEFYFISPVQDYPLTIFLSLCGTVFYMKDIMSVYRYEVPGSWSERQKQSEGDRRIETQKRIHRMLIAVNGYTDNKYSSAICELITRERIGLFYELNMLSKLKVDEYLEWYKQLSLKWKFVIAFLNTFPGVSSLLLEIRRVVRKGNG